MTCHNTVGEVAVCVSAATGLYLVTAVPLMRLARADHLTPRCVRDAAVSVAALAMLLTAPKGATR